MKQRKLNTMKHVFWAAPLAALGLAATPAAAQPASVPALEQKPASIAFVSRGGIRDWRSDGRETVYLQDRKRQWYKATLMSPSSELPFAWAIGFDTGPIDRLDHFSAIVVDGRRYPIESLVEVDGPPSDHG